jgi:UDP-N-acetyl-D-glucosamine dehydrogenase
VPALPDGGLQSVDLDRALDGADLALIVTAHPGVDYEAIIERTPLVVDLRGVTRTVGARRTVLL